MSTRPHRSCAAKRISYTTSSSTNSPSPSATPPSTSPADSETTTIVGSEQSPVQRRKRKSRDDILAHLTVSSDRFPTPEKVCKEMEHHHFVKSFLSTSPYYKSDESRTVLFQSALWEGVHKELVEALGKCVVMATKDLKKMSKIYLELLREIVQGSVGDLDCSPSLCHLNMDVDQKQHTSLILQVISFYYVNILHSQISYTWKTTIPSLQDQVQGYSDEYTVKTIATLFPLLSTRERSYYIIGFWATKQRKRRCVVRRAVVQKSVLFLSLNGS